MTDIKPEASIRLTALEDFCFEGQSIRTGEMIECSAADAKPLLMSGQVGLLRRQDLPPTDLLRSIEVDLLDVPHLGPVCLNPKVIQDFEEKVLPGGSRRHAFASSELHWCDRKKTILAMIRNEISIGHERLRSLQTQFAQCLSSKVERSEPIFRSARYSQSDAIDRGLVTIQKRSRILGTMLFGPEHYSATPSIQYAKVGTDWALFKAALERFEHLDHWILQRALRDGRILSMRKLEQRYELIPPWHWNESDGTPPRGDGWYFLCSRDLPKEWFPTAKQLRGRERARKAAEIKTWLEKEYQMAAPDHTTNRKEELISNAARKFDVSPTLVRDAWSQANIPNWKKQGRRRPE